MTNKIYERIRTYWLPLFLIAYAIAGLATISAAIAWGDDWAQYVMHARNLLAGIPYANIGYLFNADAANVGPPSYPPGLPLLLVPVLAAFGMNLVALKAACFICVLLALPCMFKALEQDFGRAVAIAATLLFAAHDQIFAIRNSISSEAPYLLVTMLGLWRLSRERAELWSGFAPAFWSGLSLGILGYLAVMCRSIGVSIVLATLVYGLAQRRPFSWFVGLVGSFSALVWLQKVLLVAPPTYGGELQRPTGALLWGNADGYLDALATIFRVPMGLSRVAAAGVSILILAGLALVASRRRGASTSGRLRALMARIPASVFYLLAYLAALLFAAIAPQSRYLWPVLPILIALAAVSVIALTGYFSRPLPYRQAVAAVLVVYYVVLNASAPRLAAQEMANCVECQELYSFVRRHTAPVEVVAFAKPRAMALLAGRASWAWPQDYSAEAFRSKLKAMHTGVVVVGAPGSQWAERNPRFEMSTSIGTDDTREVVFRNNMFVAIRLAPQPQPQ